MDSKYILLALLGAALLYYIYKNKQLEKELEAKPTQRRIKIKIKEPIAFFDISIDGELAGRVHIKLFRSKVPKTVENFMSLCNMEYKRSLIYRIEKDEYIMGGDYEENDGSGKTETAIGDDLPDENFNIKHTEPGIISMYSDAPDRATSKFIISLKAKPEFNDRYVAFGKIIKGMKIIKKINKLETDKKRFPTVECEISNCGIIRE